MNVLFERRDGESANDLASRVFDAFHSFWLSPPAMADVFVPDGHNFAIGDPERYYQATLWRALNDKGFVVVSGDQRRVTVRWPRPATLH